MKKYLHRLWREWILPVGLFLAVMTPLRSAVADWNWVPTGSMKPTILEGDLVFVNKLAYDLKLPFTTHHLMEWGAPERGDVVVLLSPRDGTRLVKRVIGLPGDRIELRQDRLYVNDVAQTYTAADAEPFRRDVSEDPHPLLAIEHLGSRDHYVMVLPGRPAVRTFAPYTVPAGSYFVMGDSRDNSLDSRFIGPVTRDRILGRASGVIVSFDPARYLQPRFGRFGRSFELPKS